MKKHSDYKNDLSNRLQGLGGGLIIGGGIMSHYGQPHSYASVYTTWAGIAVITISLIMHFINTDNK
jgi:hypothetical protein